MEVSFRQPTDLLLDAALATVALKVIHTQKHSGQVLFGTVVENVALEESKSYTHIQYWYESKTALSHIAKNVSSLSRENAPTA